MSLVGSFQKAMNFISKSSGFSKVLHGIKVLSAETGKVRCQLEVKPEHLNGAGTLHGGVTCTLVDVVSTYAIASLEGRRVGVSVDLNVSFLSAASPREKIIIESEVLRTGKSLAFANVNILKEDGKLVATGRHTKYLNVGRVLPISDSEKLS